MMRSRPFATLAALLAVLAAARPAAAATAAPPSAGSFFWAGQPDAAAFTKLEEAKLERAKAAVARLKAVKGARTLDNTLRPFDDASMELDGILQSTDLITNVSPDQATRRAAEEITQKAADYSTQLSLDRGVYDAIAALDPRGADAATRYYVQRTLRDFRLAGVDKDSTTRAAIQKLQAEIVETGQTFQRDIRSDTTAVWLDGAAALEGLPDDFVARHKPGPDGRIRLSIEYPDLFPVLTYARREETRKAMYLASQRRAYPANMAILDSLIAKRWRLAHLLGFASWADANAADKMAKDGKTIRSFVDHIVEVSGDREKADYQVLLARKQKDVPGATTIEWWDRFYWPTLVKKEQYAFDPQVLRAYFPYDRVEQGVLDVASRMFGVTFKPVKDAPVWHPSVKCYEMWDGTKLLGRFYFDMHPRKDKYSHAANFGIQTGVEGRQIPMAALVCNLPGGEPGDPGLCDLDDVNTVFHEFGHMLHNMFGGHQKWVGISGIRCEWDFVEAPSQMLEEWMRDPKVLQTFARHYQTGAPIPTELVEQMKRANAFGDQDPKGISVRRQMVLADLSLSIYDRDPGSVDTDALNARLLSAYVPYPYLPETHMQCSFTHLENYSSGYYTYMWSNVIAKDMFTAFDKSNLLDPKVARRYRQCILEPGGSKPAAQMVEDFLGRPFAFDAYKAWIDEGAAK